MTLHPALPGGIPNEIANDPRYRPEHKRYCRVGDKDLFDEHIIELHLVLVAIIQSNGTRIAKIQMRRLPRNWWVPSILPHYSIRRLASRFTQPHHWRSMREVRNDRRR